jgi:CheY-like chemotaxis protein
LFHLLPVSFFEFLLGRVAAVKRDDAIAEPTSNADESNEADTYKTRQRGKGLALPRAKLYGGKQPVGLAQQFRPDVLISDVVIPDLNGIESAVRIRAMLPSCRIVLFSGQAGAAVAERLPTGAKLKVPHQTSLRAPIRLRSSVGELMLRIHLSSLL